MQTYSVLAINQSQEKPLSKLKSFSLCSILSTVILKHLSGLYYVHLLETRTNRLKTNACANNGSD